MAAEQYACLTEEKITSIIRDLYLKQSSRNKKKSNLNIARGNFHITMKELKSFKNEISEFTKVVLEKSHRR